VTQRSEYDHHSEMDFNDGFTLANTVLCCLLIILRLFYYRNNPKLDELISRVDSYLVQGVMEGLRQHDTKGRASYARDLAPSSLANGNPLGGDKKEV